MARLRVHVTPGAREEQITDWHGGSLRVRVQARPEKGRANQAALRLLARRLGVAPANLSIVRGAASRDKLVEVDGLSEEELRARLDDSHRR
jgi:uncharacterized protein (TIGR00251 family)